MSVLSFLDVRWQVSRTFWHFVWNRQTKKHKHRWKMERETTTVGRYSTITLPQRLMCSWGIPSSLKQGIKVRWCCLHLIPAVLLSQPSIHTKALSHICTHTWPMKGNDKIKHLCHSIWEEDCLYILSLNVCGKTFTLNWSLYKSIKIFNLITTIF